MENEQVIQEVALEQEIPELIEVIPGGVIHPEGHDYIGTIDSSEEGSVRFQFDDLLLKCVIEIVGPGITLSIDRPTFGSNFGTLHGRVIHDSQGKIHIFRKDDHELGISFFVAKFGHC